MNKKFLIFPIIGILILISIFFTSQNLFPSDETNLPLTHLPINTVDLPPSSETNTAPFNLLENDFSFESRSKFCGSGYAKSNIYVREFKIPSDCSLPQAMVTDPDGNIWFVESNTGNLAKFDPILESFTEYENPLRPTSPHSMVWGMDYAPDGTIWYTDEKYDSVWKFVVQDEEYERFDFPSEDNSFPQRLEIQGSKLIINDFKGNRLVFFDYIRLGEDISEFTSPDEQSYIYSLPSNNPDAVMADFTIEGENLWFTRWVPDGFGTLSKINQTEFDLLIQNDEDDLSVELFILPTELNTPSGIVADSNENIWITDASSSLFFKFNTANEIFTQFVTANPRESTYGNYTGEIKSPVSRPYWIDMDSSGNLIFNEQGGNRIGVFDPYNESLVEYSIPSKNPHWGDCGDDPNCGIAQIFDFVIKGNEIWFTEWSENNLGVVDTTIPLPFEIHLAEDKISLHPGEPYELNFTITANSDNALSTTLILSDSSEFLDLQINDSPLEILISDSKSINVTLHADEKLAFGEYKVLLGAGTEQVSVGKFLTVIVIPSPIVVPPEISLSGDNPLTLIQGSLYVESGAICQDGQDGIINERLVINSSIVDTETLGKYRVNYNCQDSDGNAAIEILRVVNVITPVGPSDVGLNGNSEQEPSETISSNKDLEP